MSERKGKPFSLRDEIEAGFRRLRAEHRANMAELGNPGYPGVESERTVDEIQAAARSACVPGDQEGGKKVDHEAGGHGPQAGGDGLTL